MSESLLFLAFALPLGALAASIATLFWLFQKHIAGQPLLAYESRRPVPWNVLAPAALLAPSLIAVAVGMLGVRGLPAEPTALDLSTTAASASGGAVSGLPVVSLALYVAEAAARDAWSVAADDGLDLSQVWSQTGSFVLMAIVCHLALAVICGATPADLGWPESWSQTRRDIGVGATTFLATLAPVYGVQFALVTTLGPTEGHPLLEQLEVQHSTMMIVAAVAAAVFAAPLFEETAFRLVFQGWLERLVGNRKDRPAATWQEVAPGSATEPGELPSHPRPDRPPSWAPILVSGSLFALAHVGQGVAPVSLLPLGLALGYLYQRTHRLVPSMTCHALFNGFSMLLLWLAVEAGTATEQSAVEAWLALVQ
jgi:membrane protease YdiL (CAAX protease family)